MKSNNKRTKTEKVIFILASPLSWFCILGLSLLMVIGIVYSVVKTSYLSFDPSPKGYLMFWDLFKAPISVFVVGTTIFGILVALRRTIQMESQIKIAQDQYEIVEQNTQVSNYFTFMEEFIKTLKDYRATELLWSLKGADIDADFYRKLFKVFYGTEFQTHYKISDKNLNKIQYIVNETIRLFEKNQRVSDALIAEKLYNLGFGEKIVKKVSIGNRTIDSNLSSCIKLIIVILDFSDQRLKIKNIDEIIKIVTI